MDIDVLLNSALNYYPDEHKLLFQHLIKCSNQLKLSSPDNHLPLFILKKNDVYLWIKDSEVSDYPFLFTDPEEILFILYQYLSSGENLYLSKEIPLEFSKEQIEINIEKALINNDQDEFNYWVKLLKNNN